MILKIQIYYEKICFAIKCFFHCCCKQYFNQTFEKYCVRSRQNKGMTFQSWDRISTLHMFPKIERTETHKYIRCFDPWDSVIWFAKQNIAGLGVNESGRSKVKMTEAHAYIEWWPYLAIGPQCVCFQKSWRWVLSIACIFNRTHSARLYMYIYMWVLCLYWLSERKDPISMFFDIKQ